MSFSSEIKRKLAGVFGECPKCGICELAGFMGSAARLGTGGISLTTENSDAAAAIADIISKEYNIDIKPELVSGMYRIQIHKADVAHVLVRDTGYIERNINVEAQCCMGAFLRGAFLGGGSITNPEKSYHMEFDYRYSEQAKKLEEVFGCAGIAIKRTERKGHTVLYVKEYELIAGILGLMGAGGGAVDIYNISAEKEIRNGINRQMNCENANMDKIAAAYCRHMAAIEKIKKTTGLDKLPEVLREIAQLRMDYPEDSLKDLGTRLEKPIGKSGVNHRLNRLMEIADSL